MASSPIDRYLGEMERRLPLPGRRILTETRAHLLEQRDRLIADGVDLTEAEERAVAAYGPIDEVVDAIRRQGSALLSPVAIRAIPWIALALTLPAVLFIWANIIEQLAGNTGGIGVFGTVFDRWRLPIGVVLVAGPLIAFCLVMLTVIRIRFEPSSAIHGVRVQLRFTRSLLIAAFTTGLVAATVIGYGLAEYVL